MVFCDRPGCPESVEVEFYYNAGDLGTAPGIEAYIETELYEIHGWTVMPHPGGNVHICKECSPDAG